jgi:hypothetical protein
MIDVVEHMGAVFSGLSALVIEDVEDAGEVIIVRARTREGAVACPGCGTQTGRVHGYHERTAFSCASSQWHLHSPAGWEIELLPDGSVIARSPQGQVIRSHSPPPAQAAA